MNNLPNRFFIKLAFNGKNYHGWQMQDNAITIQSVINDALSKLLEEEINVTGCGRTDSGVHAKEFYAHFDINKFLNKNDRDNIVFKLNNFLDDSIVIYNIIPVKPDSHARFDAISRTYKYFISRQKDPFDNDFSYYVYGDINIDLINKGAKILYEYEDFTSFSKLHSDVKTNNCKIIDAKWIEKEDKLIFTITADRFLRNMVRAIVGTLLDIGKKKISLKDFRKIIESKNRSDAGYSVPAKGLFLTKIEYPYDIFK
jgi:tRNA pseudouridine38-40 synthase